MKKNRKLPPLVSRVLDIVRKHPFVTTLAASVLYLVIFQSPFITSGDNWAEAWYEYIHGAFVDGKSGFFAVGIAGYFNFLPKLLSYSYVLLHLPLEYIDYFLRFSVVAFVVACTAFVAHPYNRPLIKSDPIRGVLALALLMCFNHITTFSMINAWYVGFIPIILVSLSSNRFKHELHMVLYAAFALMVTLTKPSIILLPLVLYRAWRHKEYLLGFIISFGIFLQTGLLFFSDYLAKFPPIAGSLLGKAANTILYPGLLLLKSFGINPSFLAVIVLATLALLGVTYVVSRKIGLVPAVLLVVVMFGASYAALYAPDSPAPSVITHHQALFADDQKLQREVMVRMLALILLFIAAGVGYECWKNVRLVRPATVAMSALLLMLLFRPIDVTSAAVVTDLKPFRNELQSRTIDCVPIAPNALWGVTDKSTFTYPWYFERSAYGTCGRTNYGQSFHRSSFTVKANETKQIIIELEKPYALTAMSFPVRLSSPRDTTTLMLTEVETGKQFIANVAPRQFDTMANPVFNLSGAGKSTSHHFTLTSSNPNVYTGTFDNDIPLEFTYYSLQY